jgi:hypothetical protein
VSGRDNATGKLGQAMYPEQDGEPTRPPGARSGSRGKDGAVDAQFEAMDDEEKTRRTG